DGRGPECVVELRLLGNIRDAAPALAVGFVVEQYQAVVAAHEDVGPAVAVVVEGRGPVAVGEVDLVEAESCGRVLELEAADVAVKFARMADDFFAVVGSAAG